MRLQPTFPLALFLACLQALPSSAAPDVHTLSRADGSLIHYTLDRPPAHAGGLILISQGSGCAPGANNASLATVRAAFPNYAALIVEKIGIAPDSAIVDGYADCPQEFVTQYTLSQRVDDYRAVLNHLRSQSNMPAADLVLFGGSEGGLAVAMLAAQLQPRATIMLSSSSGTTFAETVRRTVPPEGHATIDAGFAAARANPDSDELFAGSTYRFWADILDVKAVDYMLASSSPILLIQGGLDTSSPLASARLAADAFAAEGRCTLTYWEFPSLDHGMKMPDGRSRMAEIAALAAQWVEAPSPAC